MRRRVGERKVSMKTLTVDIPIAKDQMNYRKSFQIMPGTHVKLKNFESAYKGKDEQKAAGFLKIEGLEYAMDKLQFCLYAEGKRSLLICLQGLDAGGKDGVVRHVVGAMNPQGCRVQSFKQPTPIELAHDFLWRIEPQVPGRGEVVIFNRSHYEDVLVVRVHDIVPEKVWSARYEQINEFERRLVDNGTHILKFFLHISKEEQLARFKKRLDDPARRWKISEADYKERKFWDAYEAAYEDVLTKCSTNNSPWFVIPSDHKWFRDLAISNIIVDTMQDLGIEVPKPTVDIADIRKKYHAAAARASKRG
jgi:PPK2 family polyphosphate:nucleotide phosphotransferase